MRRITLSDIYTSKQGNFEWIAVKVSLAKRWNNFNKYDKQS